MKEMPRKKPTTREQEKATEILEWLPRPLFNREANSGNKNGPGIDKLQSMTDLGYQSLRAISVGNSVMSYLFPKLEMLHKAMKATPVVVPIPEPEATVEAQTEVAMDFIRALQKKHSETLLEVKWKVEELSKKMDLALPMLERLMKELGVKL